MNNGDIYKISPVPVLGEKSWFHPARTQHSQTLFCYQILFSRSLSLLEEKGGKDWACGHQGPRGVRLARGGGEGQECKELALASDT